MSSTRIDNSNWISIKDINGKPYNHVLFHQKNLFRHGARMVQGTCDWTTYRKMKPVDIRWMAMATAYYRTGCIDWFILQEPIEKHIERFSDWMKYGGISSEGLTELNKKLVHLIDEMIVREP